MDFFHNGWVYFEVSKGMYGLKQSGKLANDLLQERLEAHGYYECLTTPGQWRHTWRPVICVLIVEKFRVEYIRHRHADHLIETLQKSYTDTIIWLKGKNRWY